MIMEDLDSVVAVVEELAAADGAHDGVGGVAHDVVRRDRRQVRRSLRVHAPAKQKWVNKVEIQKK